MTVNQNLIYTCNDYQYFKKEIQELQKRYYNSSDEIITLTEYNYFTIILPNNFNKLSYFTSSWGQELMKQEKEIIKGFEFENSKGRCSAQSAPFFSLSSDRGNIDFAICTSGNYKVIIKRKQDMLEVKINDINPNYKTDILPNDTFTFPMILAHYYESLEECYQVKQHYQKNKLIKNPIYNNLPVIYNHWWAYEDKHINEEIVLQNAKIAKSIGVDILVLDAGWFGNNSLTEEWFSVRGDWQLINKKRFPNGLTSLREKIEKIGLKFGIWCEIEGLGINAKLADSNPEYIAKRDGENLFYVCFGNPKVQEWAYQTMCELFKQCSAAYWKLDFNLEPNMGCNDLKHSHGSEDGLDAHYRGLYKVLERLRKKFPELIIENCSSGGQRLNIKMGEYTHIHFLSDPDYSKHQMRLFKEASKWFLPKQLLHFMWSNTVTTNDSAPFENLNLEKLSKGEIQYHMRLAMMHQFGISHRLPEYSKRTLDIMCEELTLYKETIKPFIINGDYLPVYMDDNANVFSFTYEDRILLFEFMEEPSEILFELDFLVKGNQEYKIKNLDDQSEKIVMGDKLKRQKFLSTVSCHSQLMVVQKYR